METLEKQLDKLGEQQDKTERTTVQGAGEEERQLQEECDKLMEHLDEPVRRHPRATWRCTLLNGTRRRRYRIYGG